MSEPPGPDSYNPASPEPLQGPGPTIRTMAIGARQPARHGRTDPMMRALLVGLLLAVCPAGLAAQTTAFAGVNVVRLGQGDVLPSQTVVVTGRRVTAVGSADAGSTLAPGVTVDGRGRYLVPGLSSSMCACPARTGWIGVRPCWFILRMASRPSACPRPRSRSSIGLKRKEKTSGLDPSWRAGRRCPPRVCRKVRRIRSRPRATPLGEPIEPGQVHIASLWRGAYPGGR
jgi:hypothetical protein